jgi:hypothetical protein
MAPTTHIQYFANLPDQRTSRRALPVSGSGPVRCAARTDAAGADGWGACGEKGKKRQRAGMREPRPAKAVEFPKGIGSP